ncbi:hypothetical protein [Limnoglobus roseus]|uniref:Uncharacterized protein n=1 Tax=Limnoglobus roseus TaxID=2598579 RepID=A0A5C1ADQ1_9BACT|nr:hypothetical protein [Limnoglobus roseus]QEL17499.1 hypothetical protein PX52LOC_04488 [Limnoglobus roseus]
MKAATIDVSRPVTCRVLHYNFSPKGGLEGLIVEVGGARAQVVCPPHLGHDLAAAVAEGETVELVLSEAEPSDKGPAAHPVYHLEELPHTDAADEEPGVKGIVARLNYAKHGEANGVVLDTGDFVHLKPDGMAQLGLKVGDRVKAEGETRAMDLGGRVVEATAVNGVAVKRKPKHH